MAMSAVHGRPGVATIDAVTGKRRVYASSEATDAVSAAFNAWVEAVASPRARRGARYESCMRVSDAEAWQLVDERLREMRRLPYDELCRRARGDPEDELLERSSGAFRRRTRVVTLPRERVGIRVRVDAGGRRQRAEAGVVITSTGELAPEWSRADEPPRGNPFAFGPRAMLAGLVLAALLLTIFFLLK
jgi:hypothetical protein